MPPSTPKTKFPRLAAIGAMVVLAGFLMPRLLPSASPTVNSPSSKAPSPKTPSPKVQSPTVASPTASTPDYSGFLLKMLFGTALFTGVCILWLRRRDPAPVVASGMQILATVSIGSRGQVHLVQAGPRRLLLGVDLQGVKAIAELPGLPPTQNTQNIPQNTQVLGPLRLVSEAI